MFPRLSNIVYQSNALAEFFESTKTSYDRDYAIHPISSPPIQRENSLFPLLCLMIFLEVSTQNHLLNFFLRKESKKYSLIDLMDSLSQLFKKISEMEVIYQDLKP